MQARELQPPWALAAWEDATVTIRVATVGAAGVIAKDQVRVAAKVPTPVGVVLASSDTPFSLKLTESEPAVETSQLPVIFALLFFEVPAIEPIADEEPVPDAPALQPLAFPEAPALPFPVTEPPTLGMGAAQFAGPPQVAV